MCNPNELKTTVRRCLDNIKVVDCDFLKVRLGNDKGDGGYVVLGEVCRNTHNLFSFGIGDDVSFELDFANRYGGKDYIFLFDPNLEEPPGEHRLFRFYPWSFNGRMFPPAGPSLLKIDVEWSEWDGFLSMDEGMMSLFSQIIVEFHFMHVIRLPQGDHSPYFYRFYQSVYDNVNVCLFQKYAEVLEKLNRHFRIFHIHANNSLPPVTVGGVTFPPLLEVSYVRKDLVSEFCPTVWEFPNPSVDVPNSSDRPDIENYYPMGAVHVVS